MTDIENKLVNEKVLEIMEKSVESVGYNEYISRVFSDANIVLGPYYVLERIFVNSAGYIESNIMSKLITIYKTTDSDYEYIIKNKDRVIKTIITSIFGFFLNNSINSLVVGEISKENIKENVGYVAYDILYTLYELFKLKINIDVLDELAAEDAGIEDTESDIFNVDKHVFYIMSRLVTELIGIAIADNNIKRLYRQVIDDVGKIMNADHHELSFIFSHSPIAIDIVPINISRSGDAFLSLFMVICYNY